jgi:hypothetical protein
MVQLLGREKTEAFHHKDTKINTKGHKEDEREKRVQKTKGKGQKGNKEDRRQKAENRKETKEERRTPDHLGPCFPLFPFCPLPSVF